MKTFKADLNEGNNFGINGGGGKFGNSKVGTAGKPGKGGNCGGWGKIGTGGNSTEAETVGKSGKVNNPTLTG